jgi:hypothetical protein
MAGPTRATPPLQPTRLPAQSSHNHHARIGLDRRIVKPDSYRHRSHGQGEAEARSRSGTSRTVEPTTRPCSQGPLVGDSGASSTARAPQPGAQDRAVDSNVGLALPSFLQQEADDAIDSPDSHVNRNAPCTERPTALVRRKDSTIYRICKAQSRRHQDPGRRSRSPT